MPKLAAVSISNMIINNGSKWRFTTVENKERDPSYGEEKPKKNSYLKYVHMLYNSKMEIAVLK